MSRRRWISFALAIVGAVACSNIDWRGLEIDGTKGLVGNALILLSIAGSAFYNVFSKRMLERFSPIEILFYSYCVVVVVLAPVALTLEPLTAGDLRSLTATTWVGIGTLAIFVYMGSMLVFFAALERLDAIQASLGNYLIPFFGLIIAAVALGERLTWAIIAGGLLALGSTVLGTFERKASA
jgi:drug/metabolite transporter (DMT)-like permease